MVCAFTVHAILNGHQKKKKLELILNLNCNPVKLSEHYDDLHSKLRYSNEQRLLTCS